jgi:hypothetical protein
VRCTVVLRKFLVPSSPLLHQRSGKRASQAEDQASKPQHVDPDGGRRWFEWLVALRWEDRDGCPAGDVDKLLSYLAKECIGRISGIGR